MELSPAGCSRPEVILCLSLTCMRKVHWNWVLLGVSFLAAPTFLSAGHRLVWCPLPQCPQRGTVFRVWAAEKNKQSQRSSCGKRCLGVLGGVGGGEGGSGVLGGGEPFEVGATSWKQTTVASSHQGFLFKSNVLQSPHFVFKTPASLGDPPRPPPWKVSHLRQECPRPQLIPQIPAKSCSPAFSNLWAWDNASVISSEWEGKSTFESLFQSN